MCRLDARRWVTATAIAIIGCLSGCDDGLRSNETAAIQIDPERFIITKLRPGERTEQSLTVKNVGAGVLRMINLQGEFGLEYDLYWTLGDEDASHQRIAVEDGINHSQPQSTLHQRNRSHFI